MTKTIPLETTSAGGCGFGHHAEEDLVLDVRPMRINRLRDEADQASSR